MSPHNHSKNKEIILQLPLRRNIYFLVKKYAGTHFRELERKSGLATGVIKYHLDYLTKHRIISQEKTGNTVRYFPRELSSEEKRILSLLRAKSHRAIVLCLLQDGHSTHSHITHSVRLAASTVSWHLKHLRRDKIITVENNLYSLTIEPEKIVRILTTYKGSFFDSLIDRVIDMWEA